jgi:hypothetical protein
MHHGPDTVDYKGRHYPRVFQAPSQFKVALSALGRGETRLDPFSDISRLPRLSLRLTTTERYLRLVLCERIVWYLEHPEEAKRLVRKNSSKNINRDEMQVNRIRLMNVLFSDAIRPILHTRNEPLHKDDMTDGHKFYFIGNGGKKSIVFCLQSNLCRQWNDTILHPNI